MSGPSGDGFDEQTLDAIRSSLSEARFSRYLHAAKSNASDALKLYIWNSKLSESFYLPLQFWEVGIRNKLHTFLSWKFTADWPRDQRALRQLTRFDQRRIREAIERQVQRRKVFSFSADVIVADLSAGFWVALLNHDYEIPFAWRRNLTRIFPADPTLSILDARMICNNLLSLRNRIAHHEPIYHLPLPERREQLNRVVAAMCPEVESLLKSMETFPAIWASKP